MNKAKHTVKSYLSSFGRNRGRSLRPYQQGLVDTLLPKLSLPLGGGGLGLGWRAKHQSPFLESGENHPHPASPLEGEEYSKVALEIGFGGGEHLLVQAQYNPDTLFIGCEPFINGVAKCLAGIDADNIQNIRLFTHDARELVQAMPAQSVDSIFILFPDPWPKLRHNKRRLVNAETLEMLARIHKPGGRLLIATDHEDYSVWILEQLLTTPHYQWQAKEQADWTTPPKDWTETKYQRKTSAEGRAPVFMECVRLINN